MPGGLNITCTTTTLARKKTLLHVGEQRSCLHDSIGTFSSLQKDRSIDFAVPSFHLLACPTRCSCLFFNSSDQFLDSLSIRLSPSSAANLTLAQRHSQSLLTHTSFQDMKATGSSAGPLSTQLFRFS